LFIQAYYGNGCRGYLLNTRTDVIGIHEYAEQVWLVRQLEFCWTSPRHVLRVK